MQPCGASVPSSLSKLPITLSGSRVWIPHKAAPETVCRCIISNLEWELGTGIPLIIQWTHTVSGAALWSIRTQLTQLSLKVTDNTTDTHRLRCSIVGYSYLTCFHSKLLIIQLTRTVSGAALWGIRTQLPLKAASLLLSSHHLQATPHKSCTVCML